MGTSTYLLRSPTLNEVIGEVGDFTTETGQCFCRVESLRDMPQHRMWGKGRTPGSTAQGTNSRVKAHTHSQKQWVEKMTDTKSGLDNKFIHVHVRSQC